MDYKNYYTLLAKKKVNEVKKAYLNKKIKEEKRILHKQLKEEHRSIFLICDILVVLMILLHFSALFITNYMVVKEHPEATFYETNPTTAGVGDYELHPESSSLYSLFILIAISWIIIILTYLHLRYTSYTFSNLKLMLVMVIVLFIFYLSDFINDFGYLVGRLF